MRCEKCCGVIIGPLERVIDDVLCKCEPTTQTESHCQSPNICALIEQWWERNIRIQVGNLSMADIVAFYCHIQDRLGKFPSYAYFRYRLPNNDGTILSMPCWLLDEYIRTKNLLREQPPANLA